MRAFLAGAFAPDVNRTNPLGRKGELAEAFAHLMDLLWRVGAWMHDHGVAWRRCMTTTVYCFVTL